MLWFHCITIQHSENNQHASQSEKTIILYVNFQEVHYYALSGVPLKAQSKHTSSFSRKLIAASRSEPTAMSHLKRKMIFSC